MTNYISISDYNRLLHADLERTNGLSWSDYIPLDQKHLIPDKEGIIILYNKDKEIVGGPAIAATNMIQRRVDELLEDKEERYKNAKFVRYIFEENQNARFSTRTDIKHLLKRIEIPPHMIENVLEDNDPRILERNRKLQAEITKQLY